MSPLVVPHDPAWREDCEREARRLRDTLGSLVVGLHHIGSTAIPGIPAKPILDLLMEASDLELLDARTPAIEDLGYEAMGEYGIPGRRYFRKHDASGTRTHHLHAFAAGSPDIARHLVFRDYLRAHSEAARAYGVLKEELADRHPEGGAAYVEGKSAFVRDIEARALQWSRAGNRIPAPNPVLEVGPSAVPAPLDAPADESDSVRSPGTDEPPPAADG